MAYSAYLTTLKNVTKDPNSDRLYTATCMGESVIVGEMAEGERVLYMPAGGQLDYNFALQFNLLRKDKDGTPRGGYLEDNAHIKALTLRGLRSEGIVISLACLATKYDVHYFPDSPISSLNGKPFCWKYLPPQRGDSSTPRTTQKGKKAGRVVFPDFAMHEDTAQLRYNLNAFKRGDVLQITLKVHGTSQRSAYTKAIMPRGFFRRLFRLPAKEKYLYVCGTRRVALNSWDTGYYGNDEFRKFHHERLIPHLDMGMEVFYEVVGYANSKTTIMPSVGNQKLGKDFVKQYGDTTDFTYGCLPGQSKMFIYRITTGDGKIEFSPTRIIEWCEDHGFDHVPYLNTHPNMEFGYFPFTTVEDLISRVESVYDGPDPIGKTHLREGVVVRKVGSLTFQAWKDKPMSFKILSGIVSESVASGVTAVDDSLLEEI